MNTNYFLGATTANGFVSRFDQLHADRRIRKLIILKGGPGCGKSTFMKKLRKTAAELGADTESSPCASDPSSLDALLIPAAGLAVVDGTAPHAVATKRKAAGTCVPAAETVKKHSACRCNRAAGELEGARPASNWIGERPKNPIFRLFRVSYFAARQNTRSQSAVKKVPWGLFLTSWAAGTCVPAADRIQFSSALRRRLWRLQMAL